jgi:D-glycero-D-manno-heptose 1,7-bisphosphate phosphatase
VKEHGFRAELVTMKLLLLDMDGTVRMPISDNKFINQPDDQRLIDGVSEAIAHYSDWTIIGITNQAGVAAGHKSLEDAIAEQQYTLKLCPWLDAIYFCPDFEGNLCFYVNKEERVVAVHEHWGKYRHMIGSFRKPNPGMLILAVERFLWNLMPISRKPNKEFVLYAGDREEDQLAAQAAYIPFIWADNWRKEEGQHSSQI